jgi:zinc/manganese transport system substrate-binding protein
MLAVALCAVLVGCSRPAAGPAPSTPASASINVVASTNVYGAVAVAVGGDHISVTSIIHSPDADPHEYESTPADALAVSKASVLVANGGGYDDFAGKLLAAANPKPTLIDVSELSGLKAQLKPDEEFNEHVWYSLPTMAKLADQLAGEFGKADPADAAAFTANAGAFKSKLDGLSAKVEQIKAGHGGQRVAITETVPLYLVEATGLVDATPPELSEAVEKGSDPPAAVLNEALALFRGDPVRALLANTQTENATTKQVEQAAAAAAVPVVAVSETLPAGVNDYVSWMGGQIEQLSAALGRRQ